MFFTSRYIEEISNLTKKTMYLVGESVREYFITQKIIELSIITFEDVFSIAKNFANGNNNSYISFDKKHKKAKIVIHNDDKIINIKLCIMNGKDIYEDLAQRDFTMNALAVKIKDGKIDFNDVIDPYGGVEDIKSHIIREVNTNIFEKDPIRMLRVVRFMSQLNFNISDEMYELIKKNKYKIREIPGEKIGDEIFKILGLKRSYYYFNFMDEHLGILNEIFPEIEPMKEVGKCRYHVVDAWIHSLNTMKVIEQIIYADGYFEKHIKEAYEKHSLDIIGQDHSRIQLIKLAALFHDIGKPKARWIDETQRVRFTGHEIIGKEIIEDICNRLNLNIQEKECLSKIVKEHMWTLMLYRDNNVSGRILYDLFENFGEYTLDIILVGLADIISTRQLLNPDEEMTTYKIHAEYIVNNYLIRFQRLEDIFDIIDVNDILKKLDTNDKSIISNMFDSVKKAVFCGDVPLERESILEYIERNLSKEE